MAESSRPVRRSARAAATRTEHRPIYAEVGLSDTEEKPTAASSDLSNLSASDGETSGPVRATKRSRSPSDDDEAFSEIDSPPPPKSRRTRKPKTSVPKSDLVASTSKSEHHASLHSVERVLPLRAPLLAWYDSVKSLRPMPWRKDYDSSLDAEARAQRAYEVLVSEIMLQQTQCATVVPYYEKWLLKFPTISALAESDIETVNGAWKGLGYYRRAKMLFAAAKKVVQDFSGRIPDDVRTLEKDIPGVGRYTAGAVASIVYNVRTPAVDGNVQRLLSRLLALHAPLKSKGPSEMIWDAGSALVRDVGTPGAFNQALIELGSTVCKPTNPDCAKCPLKDGCGAYSLSKGKNPGPVLSDIEDACTVCEAFPDASSVSVTRFPMKIEKKRAREEDSAVCVVEWRSPADERWFLIVRRPDKGLLGGLWEFPTHDFCTPPSTSALDTAPRTILSSILASSLHGLGSSPTSESKSESRSRYFKASAESDSNGDSLRITQVNQAGSVLHIFSHIRKTYHGVWVVLEGGPSGGSDAHDLPLLVDRKETGKKGETAKWIRESEVDSANMGTGTLKVWKLVQPLWGAKEVVEEKKPAKRRRATKRRDA
ncbi:hypothetical protein BOTBODRAFT_149988 [Botryobasidium botryosum FD-172 SS1]|uniref:Adenine DNA glycosylase n=1 Tax=Botryobasidium botryosum (strain FD-172 SS1) TaxID=930990 RepID=A0A067NAR1_BOTB1|nr:hypothetical protein BOTBODRAFT_149988 [Botryobasidium botryosum FD-172 SS1]